MALLKNTHVGIRVRKELCGIAPRPCGIRQHRLVSARSSLTDKLKQAMDFGKNGRVDVINRMYYGEGGTPSKQVLEDVLSSDFQMGEEGYTRKFSKDAAGVSLYIRHIGTPLALLVLVPDAADYIRMVCDITLPAIPDFKWGHATSGDVDGDGWCIVTVQASGHHTGHPLQMPGLEPLPPSGKHFCLAEEIQKVKVQGNKVVAVEVLPQKGAGPRALYQALGGKLPTQQQPVAAPPVP